jgi:hypothetical protein
MPTIITQPVQVAHQIAAIDRRRRTDRLARATVDQMQTALAFLGMIDPEAFDIAFTAVPGPVAEGGEDDGAEPLCGACGAPVAIFPDLGPEWQHYRGDLAATGCHQVYDPGHAPEVAWYDLDDMTGDF